MSDIDTENEIIDAEVIDEANIEGEAGEGEEEKKKISITDEQLKEILTELTDLEKKYCEILIMQRPRTKSEALKRAGSKANPRNLNKMSWEIEQRPHVKVYMQYLREKIAVEAGLGVQEIINNARKGVEMAYMLGKPRDADPHNRLLAELGGFLANNATSNATQTNIKIENNLKEENVEDDLKRLEAIIADIS